MARKQKPQDDDGGQPERKPTIKLTTTITQEADEVIRRTIFEARGNNQAWWEAAGQWLVEHPEALAEITARMTADLGGRRRR